MRHIFVLCGTYTFDGQQPVFCESSYWGCNWHAAGSGIHDISPRCWCEPPEVRLRALKLSLRHLNYSMFRCHARVGYLNEHMATFLYGSPGAGVGATGGAPGRPGTDAAAPDVGAAAARLHPRHLRCRQLQVRRPIGLPCRTCLRHSDVFLPSRPPMLGTIGAPAPMAHQPFAPVR